MDTISEALNHLRKRADIAAVGALGVMLFILTVVLSTGLHMVPDPNFVEPMTDEEKALNPKGISG